MTTTLNADDGVVSGSAGLKYSADSTGVLALQTNGTTAVSISASQVVTLTNALAEASGGTGTTTGYYGFKNRIINGAMVIDQRNAGASVTPAASDYTLDRWLYEASQVSKFSIEQTITGVAAPAGFTDYLGMTVVSAVSIGAGDYFAIGQRIEGYNFSDLGWGTVDAKTVTLSFQVRSSLTGTFGGSISNGAANRGYPFTYTISSANTWTSISVTIAGDTTGTWSTNNTNALRLWLGLGVGSTYNGTAGAWAAGTYISATGATSVVGTNGATFYITGVQLEKGSTATSFDYRPYGTELQLAQRYCQVAGGGASGQWWSAASPEMGITFAVPFRSAPTYTMFTTSVSVSEIATATRTSVTAAAQGGTLTINGGNVRIDGFTGATQFRGALCLTNCFLLVAEL